jgi:hypothetical protein
MPSDSTHGGELALGVTTGVAVTVAFGVELFEWPQAANASVASAKQIPSVRERVG